MVSMALARWCYQYNKTPLDTLDRIPQLAKAGTFLKKEQSQINLQLDILLSNLLENWSFATFTINLSRINEQFMP